VKQLRFAILGLVLMAIPGCNTLEFGQPSVSPPTMTAQTRTLSASEQTTLGHQIAVALKDPGSAQFQWPSVVLGHEGGITDYCGFVSGRFSGGNFTEFYAQLIPDTSGQFTKATLRSIASDNSDIATRATADDCARSGYGGISVQ
jgi:hypothetical protein